MSAWGWAAAILAGISALYLYLIAPARKRPNAAALKGWLYAHRGLHDSGKEAPENSMTAFRRAAEAGFGIELDVQLTADGQLVVFHDENLNRMCGRDARLYTLTYADLLTCPLPDGSAIPLFADVLRLVNGRVPLIVEIKYHHEVTQIAEETRRALSEYRGAYCVESFHPLAVRHFKIHAPQVVRGTLVYGGPFRRGETKAAVHVCVKHMLLNVLCRPHFIACSVPGDRAPSMWLMKHLFRPLLAAWTLRDPAALASTASAYDFPIFEGFVPDISRKDR